MVFYNKGVTLGSSDSPVVEYIREIEKMGVDVLFCSTCVKFYSLEEKISVGSLAICLRLHRLWLLQAML